MYRVYLEDCEAKEEVVSICKTRQDLSDLLLHLDAEHYEITKIISDSTIYEDYKTFIKKDPNLEIGDKKK